MSGHSKWSTIKHKKAKLDAQRGKVFTKIIRELTIAARMGGGDPTANPRLRTALDNARSANMPKDNIEKAIKKGTGELEGVNYEEATYEGYGPGGVAVLVEVLTDNRNRITAELRHAFTKHNGNLGESGCVGWIFERRGRIVLEGDSLDEDAIMELAIEAGADDVEFDEGMCEILTSPDAYEAVKEAVLAAEHTPTSMGLTRIPSNQVAIDEKTATSLFRMIDVLEDNDDVQNVYANFDVPDEVMEAMSA